VKNVLVAYYSRTGNTRKVAEVLCEALRARGGQVKLEEIVDRKSRRGLLGLASACFATVCGRETQITEGEAGAAGFDLVVVGTPVWRWGPTPAALAFCKQHAGAVTRCGLFCTMLGPTPGSALSALGSALGREPAATLVLSRGRLKDAQNWERDVLDFAAALLPEIESAANQT
jgi:hypothetical protein